MVGVETVGQILGLVEHAVAPAQHVSDHVFHVWQACGPLGNPLDERVDHLAVLLLVPVQ